MSDARQILSAGPMPFDGALRAPLRRLARAIDAKHPATAGHSDRVAAVATLLAAELGWSPRRRRALHDVGLVHDVGKAVVPDDILIAPRRLTLEETALVRTHAAVGGVLVLSAYTAAQGLWVWHHHERWDGSGYPDGLTGAEIPAEACLLGLADAWDAMTHRPLSGRLGREAALEECRAESGRQFAPWAVDLLTGVVDRLPIGAERRRSTLFRKERIGVPEVQRI